MPVIIVKTVKGVVLTSDEQKRELLKRMTDTFIDIVGDVARPYTYCIIEETPMYEWSLAGVPLPDLAYLSGPDYAELHRKANNIMHEFLGSQGDPAEAKAARDAAQERWAPGSQYPDPNG